MASLEVDGDDLLLRLGPWERLGSLQRDDIRIARRLVIEARSVHNAYAEARGLRVPGTGVPGRLLLGTWRTRDSKSFVAVRGKGPGCVIELAAGRFDQWIVSEPLPEELQS